MSAAPPTGTTPVPCRACGTALVPLRPTPADVTHGTVAAAAVGPLGWACPESGADHDRRVPSDDAATAALRSSLVVARRTLLRRELRCGECDEAFPLPGRRTTRTVTITWDGPAVTVTLDLPVLRCAVDAVDNVPPEAADDAAAALRTLLAGLP